MSDLDIEQKLKSATLRHLTDDELLAYRDNELDEITLGRAQAHLKRCVLCENSLAFHREEAARLAAVEITPEDLEVARRVMKELNAAHPLKTRPSAPSLIERLKEYLLDSTEVLQAYFLPLAATRDSSENELKKWISGDGLFDVSITLQDTADLAIHIHSKERGFIGQRIRVRLGSFTDEAILKRASESEVYARIEVPKEKRPRNLGSISIELA